MPRTKPPESSDAQLLALLQQLLAAIGLLRDVPADLRQIQADIHALRQEFNQHPTKSTHQ